MTDDDIIELWEERAAIIEEGCSTSVEWRIKPQQWRQREAERLAYWDIKKKHGVQRMPQVTSRWRSEVASGG